ncbi:helix-turn-helix domain-containing protein, partial [Parabacteroides distasonis]|uniref:helix-turn-helix domain-containing protein n=1 Tax=Parabacteroides distasonis TaxID=823 RepID=UPI0012FAAF10
IGYAARMLVDTQRSIAEICYDCGFNNLSNFNRIFKKKKNCSPKEFRDPTETIFTGTPSSSSKKER